jgi:periplasmic mercuric ion binding protein
MKKLILILFLAFVGFNLNAQETKKNKNAKHTIVVNGNCEQCQKRIQKAALGVSGVKLASWNVETHQLNLILNETKCSVTDVKRAIAKVGHDTDEVKATDKDYDNLHSCCKYVRE